MRRHLSPTSRSKTLSKKLHIEIFGRQYILRGQSDQGYADSLALYVHEKIQNLSENSVGSPFSKLAVLSAINIAHELFELKIEHEKLLHEIDGKTQTIIKQIDGELEKSSS